MMTRRTSDWAAKSRTGLTGRLAKAGGLLAALFFLAFGMPTVPEGAKQPEGAAQSIDERIKAVRERINLAQGKAADGTAPQRQLAQWYNWSNWSNAWDNYWPNWTNYWPNG